VIPYIGPEMVESLRRTYNSPKAVSAPQSKHAATYQNKNQPTLFLQMLFSLRHFKALVAVASIDRSK
jgi:hypothetical protein